MEYTVTIKEYEGVFKVINTHIPENTSVNVSKVWTDDENRDGIRPENVTVKLLQNGTEYRVAVLNDSSDWNYTFINLPKYHDKGVEYIYTVFEVAVPGYTSESSIVDGVIVINNTHELVTKNITVTKLWDDVDTTKDRPDNVTVFLKADGDVVANVTLTGDDWNATFDDLPVYRNGSVRVEIVYTIEELTVANYTNVISNNSNDFTITNTHVPELVNITVKKVWYDSENQDKMRPEQVTIKLKSSDGKEYIAVMECVNGKWNYTFMDLPKYSNGAELVYSAEEVIVPAGYNVSYSEDNLTITNTHELVTKNITVVKVWDDNNDNDKVRPTEVKVDLYADNAYNQTATIKADDWTYTFTNLTVYRAGKVGEEIVYTIREHEVANYTSVVSNISDYFTVTNTHNDSLINLTINKVWDDSNNNDNIRPENITVRLRADGTEYKIVIVSGDEWTYNFTDLPEYNNGIKITYTIEEVNVPAGYTASVDGTTITNKHENITKNINVSKVWNDNGNNDNARTSVVVELLAGDKVVNTTTLNESNGWKATFENLPVNKDGKPVVYNISEVNVDHYITEITECNGNFIITNTLVPELVNITVNKVWNDSDNQDNIRPDEVTLKLKANGQEYVVPYDIHPCRSHRETIDPHDGKLHLLLLYELYVQIEEYQEGYYRRQHKYQTQYAPVYQFHVVVERQACVVVIDTSEHSVYIGKLSRRLVRYRCQDSVSFKVFSRNLLIDIRSHE